MRSRNSNERDFAAFCSRNNIGLIVNGYKRRFSNEADAEDFEGRLLLIIWESIGTIYGLEYPRAYVAGIARNLFNNIFRGQYIRRDKLGHHQIEADEAEAPPLLPEDLAEVQYQDRLNFFEELGRVANLSEEHLQVLIAYYLDLKTGPMIAAELGTPEATVRTRLHMARKAIRKVGFLKFEELMFYFISTARLAEAMEDFGVKIPIGNFLAQFAKVK